MVTTRPEVTGLVLAGGTSRRMGRDKASLPWPPGGRTKLLDRTVGTLLSVCREVLVVGREHPGHRSVPDALPGQGPLMGLAAGLRAAECDWCLAVAADLPFLRGAMLEALLGHAGGQAVVPRVGGRAQPLLALYHRSCLGPIEEALARGKRRMDSFWPAVEVRLVEEETLRAHDPALLSFRNLNRPEDLEAAQALWASLSRPRGPR